MQEKQSLEAFESYTTLDSIRSGQRAAVRAQTIECQVKINQCPIGPLHVVSQPPVIIRQVLNHRSHTNEFWMCREVSQGGHLRPVFKVYPADYRSNMVSGIGTTEEVFGFLDCQCGQYQHSCSNTGSC